MFKIKGLTKRFEVDEVKKSISMYIRKKTPND